MIASNYHQQYLKTKVETASPGELTLLLYEELHRKLNMAKLHFEKNQPKEMLQRIDGARSILYELLGTLNFEYEISVQLRDLYQFYLSQLNLFVIKKEADLLDSVIEFSRGLADTWKQAILLAKSNRG
ncbi:flagellar export chaperone FliS [Paenibacillus sp. Y412MC10]|uniref:flagellar export chaperone FliS n=1 Tax=Geobacillus sp. (strain Y412MC10) TaxID=481743 RepID=UPI0011A8D724|nr:flagellar export chaperone FliS [Paenibacillus sp. Y412MC10]